MLLFLVCKERREKVMNELIEFIHQLSVENAEIVVRTLKEPICFVKEGKRKQLTLLVIVIRLDNNFWTNTQALVDSGYTRSYIN